MEPAGSLVGGVMDRHGFAVIATLVVGVPAAVFAVWVLAKWRLRRGASESWAWRASVAEVGLVIGTVPWVWMIMTPRPGIGGISLVPFQDLLGMIHDYHAVVQIGGNLLVLAAFGFFLPIRFRLAPRARVPFVVAAIAICASVFFEFSQGMLHLGRVSSVDDVLLNCLGAVIACLASMRWWRAGVPVPALQSRQGSSKSSTYDLPGSPQSRV